MATGGNKKTGLAVFLGAFVLGIAGTLGFGGMMNRTTSSEYCMRCHYHEQADADWKKSEHFNTHSGVVIDCAACHLPPREDGLLPYYYAKIRVGVKDIWMKWTHKPEDIDWEAKRDLAHARGIVFNASCVKCHANLFPEGISDEGITAHLYYEENAVRLQMHCIDCHLNTGHFLPGYQHKKLEGRVETGGGTVYDRPAEVTAFADFTETVPGTNAALRMVAVPGGTFTLGSPEGEAYRSEDEGPQRRVTLSAFFMGEVEVTWQQYWAFYNETMSEGRTPPAKVYANNSRPDVDAVSGPTPPFGFPDQGWGMGERPAITMTHYAAETFCQWLSLKTGRTYRLPTEAEWEYAARGGTDTPYWFEGDPRRFSHRSLRSRIFKPDTVGITGRVIYDAARTEEPRAVKANPFGLKNMLGNVMEYCADRYDPQAYAALADGAVDPRGPAAGEEYVVRGGCFSDDAALVRCAARAHTHHDDWLRTDPQDPKSIWWYSDIRGVGFRVVCEVPETLRGH